MSNCEIIITFSPDEYKAYGEFIPAIGEGLELNHDYAKAKISEAEIVEGVDWQTITRTIDLCNKSRKSKSNVLIATGLKPMSEVPPHWNLEERFFKNAMGLDIPSDEKVDYREFSKFIMVKKGDLIAKWDNGRPGVNGKTVKGKTLPYKKKKIVQFTNGKNTAKLKGNLYATTAGRYEVSEEMDIHVNDVLEIEGNVDYSTGNISFAKDVIINGEIKDGFKVAAGGSLYCKSNVDATDILCRNDLIADKGIIGRGEAIVRVGGTIKAIFIENCHIESKSGIEVEKNIMNSKVFSLGSIKLGEKGRLVNCVATVEQGVVVQDIGKEGSPASELKLGYSFIDKRAIDSIEQRMNVLKDKLNTLNKLPDYRKTDKKVSLISQISTVLNRGNQELQAKKDQLYKYPNATVSVKGTVYAGTKIEICGVKFSVTSDMRMVKFYLDEKTGGIETTPI